jgi:hypothetical protein
LPYCCCCCSCCSQLYPAQHPRFQPHQPNIRKIHNSNIQPNFT